MWYCQKERQKDLWDRRKSQETDSHIYGRMKTKMVLQSNGERMDFLIKDA